MSLSQLSPKFKLWRRTHSIRTADEVLPLRHDLPAPFPAGMSRPTSDNGKSGAVCSFQGALRHICLAHDWGTADNECTTAYVAEKPHSTLRVQPGEQSFRNAQRRIPRGVGTAKDFVMPHLQQIRIIAAGGEARLRIV